MYLIKLLPEQIAKHWEILKFAISKALPPIANESEEKMSNILQALLLEQMQCWVTSEEAAPKQLHTVLTTRIANDEITQTKNLLIYSLFSYVPLSYEDVKAMHDTLIPFAKANHCHRVLAYTDDDNVIAIARKFGMNPTYQLLSLDV